MLKECHILIHQRKERAVIRAYPRRTRGPFVVERQVPLELLPIHDLRRQTQLSKREAVLCFSEDVLEICQ